jgi:hypothetical protein
MDDKSARTWSSSCIAGVAIACGIDRMGSTAKYPAPGARRIEKPKLQKVMMLSIWTRVWAGVKGLWITIRALNALRNCPRHFLR